MGLLQKKNKIRTALKEMGILKKGKENDFDKYKYFSEAQYKELFTKLFSNNEVEFSSSVDDVWEFIGTQKMPFGRRVKMSFTISDVETGEKEVVVAFGEGTDKGDKALYKAMTGAVKYYFANNFIVATGDDAEKESDDSSPVSITKEDAEIITAVYGKAGRLGELLEAKGVANVENLSYEVGRELVQQLREKQGKKNTV